MQFPGSEFSHLVSADKLTHMPFTRIIVFSSILPPLLPFILSPIPLLLRALHFSSFLTHFCLLRLSLSIPHALFSALTEEGLVENERVLLPYIYCI